MGQNSWFVSRTHDPDRGPTEFKNFARGGIHKGASRPSLIGLAVSLAYVSGEEGFFFTCLNDFYLPSRGTLQEGGEASATCGVDENWFIENSNTVTLLSLVMLANLHMMIKAREMRAGAHFTVRSLTVNLLN